MHGKVDKIEHAGRGLFAGLESPIEATRYHSLVIDPPTLPRDFEVDAWSTAPDGTREIMAIRHKTLPVYGVQFHPESILTRGGFRLLANFLTRAGVPHHAHLPAVLDDDVALQGGDRPTAETAPATAPVVTF